jgi:hypothetical protein
LGEDSYHPQPFEGKRRRNRPLHDLRKLRTPHAAVAAYGTPFALSTAFKRVRGISPQQHKLAAAG